MHPQNVDLLQKEILLVPVHETRLGGHWSLAVICHPGLVVASTTGQPSPHLPQASPHLPQPAPRLSQLPPSLPPQQPLGANPNSVPHPPPKPLPHAPPLTTGGVPGRLATPGAAAEDVSAMPTLDAMGAATVPGPLLIQAVAPSATLPGAPLSLPSGDATPEEGFVVPLSTPQEPLPRLPNRGMPGSWGAPSHGCNQTDDAAHLPPGRASFLVKDEPLKSAPVENSEPRSAPVEDELPLSAPVKNEPPTSSPVKDELASEPPAVAPCMLFLDSFPEKGIKYHSTSGAIFADLRVFLDVYWDDWRRQRGLPLTPPVRRSRTRARGSASAPSRPWMRPTACYSGRALLHAILGALIRRAVPCAILGHPFLARPCYV